jgi:glycosyltransferase involved in cell wall biosynthesis
MLAAGITKIPADVNESYKKHEDKIRIVGRQPMDKIPVYLATGDVLVLPMFDRPAEIARWPIRFGEYLASGRAIISNAVGEVKTIMEEENCGLTCPVKDMDAFSELAIKLLNDREMAKKLGMRARKVAEEKYSWDISAKMLEKLYNETVR